MVLPTPASRNGDQAPKARRSEEHTSELQSRLHLVCRLLLEKKITDERLYGNQVAVFNAGRAVEEEMMLKIATARFFTATFEVLPGGTLALCSNAPVTCDTL